LRGIRYYHSREVPVKICAIVFAYKPNGEIVIWEANPHPALSNKEPSKTRITQFLSEYYQGLF
jgi:hypothetical protein